MIAPTRMRASLLVAVVGAVATSAAHRNRGSAGSQGVVGPTDFTYDLERFDAVGARHVVGGSAACADTSCLDPRATERLTGAHRPLSSTWDTTEPAALPNSGTRRDGDAISCRLILAGQGNDERTATDVAAQVLGKFA